MHIVRHWSRDLVVAIFALSLSGCILEFGKTYGTGVPGGNSSYLVDADITVQPCVLATDGYAECTFRAFAYSALARAKFPGAAGVLVYWLDPIILQVPVGISDLSGTFSGPASGSLSITTVTGPLQADATRQIIPEPGTKFLIIDFPGGVPPGGAGRYHFQFSFTVPSAVASPLALKVVFAAKATVGTQTYYSPLFPCTTNMANVPALTVPTSNMFTPLNLTPYLTQQACNNVTYDLTPGGSAPTAAVVEYHHSGFDHYFITPSAAEIALLDARTPPFQDWSRTGLSFNAYANATAPTGSVAICRFFNDHYAPKSSHFYAAQGFGCEATLAQFPDWGLEDDKLFNTMLPDANGACPQGTNPVYRLYNQGMGAAPNHRFVTTLAEQQVMVNRGFVAEGVVMCVPP